MVDIESMSEVELQELEERIAVRRKRLNERLDAKGMKSLIIDILHEADPGVYECSRAEFFSCRILGDGSILVTTDRGDTFKLTVTELFTN